MDLEGLTSAAWRLAPGPAVVVDEAVRVLGANAAFEALWSAGLPPHPPLAGRALASLLAPEDEPRLRREIEAMTDRPRTLLARLRPLRGEPVTVELAIGLCEPRGDGGWRVVECRPVQGDDAVARLNRRIFDALDSGVLWYDADLHIVDANQAARRMLALRPDDLGRVRSDDLGWRQFDETGQPLPIERRPAWLALHGRQPLVTTTMAVETPAGGRRWLRVTAQAVSSVAPGRGPGAVVSFVDVSEQRQAQRSQRESELLLRLFGDNASDVLWIVDPRSRRLLYVNAAWERLWGQPTARLYEDIDHWLDGIHPDDLPRVLHAAQSPTVRGTYEVEYRLQPPDGPLRWIRGRGFPIHDGDGRVRYLAGFAEDITLARESAAMREAHRAAQARLERIVATAPGAVVSYRWHADGRVELLYASAAIEQVTGFTAEALKAGAPPLHALVHADDRPRLQRSLEQAERRRHAWRDTFRLWRGGGRADLRWIDAHSLPVDPVRQAEDADPDAGPDVDMDAGATPAAASPERADGVLWHGFLIDVTGRRRAEEEVRQLNADLERRVAERTAELESQHREMEAFTYSVSHDLKAPLRGIDGYSRLLEADHLERLDDDGRFFVAMIRKATQQMGQLIDDLLAYSRVERGRPVLVAFDPAPFVRRLVAEREDEVRAAGGEIVVSLAGGEVIGEREGLLLVLRNLIDNAIKFTAGVARRRIEVSSARTGDGEHVRFAVRDNGRGFEMRYHDRIFEIFQRLHRADDFPGTGVGLAIVRKAAERMHGRAWAESAPGAGATFWLELRSAEGVDDGPAPPALGGGHGATGPALAPPSPTAPAPAADTSRTASHDPAR